MTESPLLPVGSASFAGDPRLLPEVRRIGERYGMDYTDDAAVRVMLSHHEAAIRRTGRSAPVRVAGLTIVTGVIWPFVIPELLQHPGFDDTENFHVADATRNFHVADATRNFLLAYAVPALLLIVGVGLAVRVHRTARRQLRHPELVGYRTVLAATRACGVPLAHIPDWLVGRGTSTGTSGASAAGVREAAPLPAYELPPAYEPADREAVPEVPEPAPEPAPATVPRQEIPAVPRKPFAVTEFEALADKGGWHDEIGFLLIVVAAIGAGWGYVDDKPVGYLIAVVLAAVGVWVWLTGRAQGKVREGLREEAEEYVRRLTAAQAAGATIPALSPALTRLAADGEKSGKAM
ncbi:hypothetical protein [Streptomyces sp. 150FB]|uniref:hypothetical protein n=1 Tax=Streptomyces sp. 150FB TaxID=1576605 RepID=UPI0007C7A2E1|nr:hypothetical protein [Streptomyces sp. 150FB]